MVVDKYLALSRSGYDCRNRTGIPHCSAAQITYFTVRIDLADHDDLISVVLRNEVSRKPYGRSRKIKFSFKRHELSKKLKIPREAAKKTEANQSLMRERRSFPALKKGSFF